MSVSDVSIQTSERDDRREARKRERHAERRRLIMQSARSLLVLQGIENFTIAQVAAVASVSKPAVYYYFDSKEDLVYALSVEVLVAERAQLERIVNDATSAVDALAALVRSRIDFYVHDRDSFRILHVWGPMLGLQARLDSSPQHAALLGLVTRIAARLVAEREQKRVPSRVEAVKVPALAWAMSQGILAMTVLGPTRERDLARTSELRDGACRWLLDSLVR
jgi:TetR/AcrR family transcriptional regulator